MKQKKQEKNSDQKQKNSLLKLIHDKFHSLGWKQRDLVKKTGIERGPISKLIVGSPKGVYQDQIGMEAAYEILKALDLLNLVEHAEMSNYNVSNEALEKYQFLKYLLHAVADKDNEMIEQALRKGVREIIGEAVYRKEPGTQKDGSEKKKTAV